MKAEDFRNFAEEEKEKKRRQEWKKAQEVLEEQFSKIEGPLFEEMKSDVLHNPDRESVLLSGDYLFIECSDKTVFAKYIVSRLRDLDYNSSVKYDDTGEVESIYVDWKEEEKNTDIYEV